MTFHPILSNHQIGWGMMDYCSHPRIYYGDPKSTKNACVEAGSNKTNVNCSQMHDRLLFPLTFIINTTKTPNQSRTHVQMLEATDAEEQEG